MESCRDPVSDTQLPCSFIFWAQHISDNDGLIFHAACLVPLLQDQKLVANSALFAPRGTVLVLLGRGMTSFNKLYGAISHSYMLCGNLPLSELHSVQPSDSTFLCHSRTDDGTNGTWHDVIKSSFGSTTAVDNTRKPLANCDPGD